MSENVKICTFDEVEAEEVRWLWKPYIAYGKLTVIQGDPGNGKTALALAIAALVSRRQKMPTGNAKPVIGNVLFQSGEDSPKDTVKPRLVACGADCSKIAFVENEGGLNLKILESAIRNTNSKYIVIDPLQAFLAANQDISSTRNMRPFLRELGNIAERTGAAIIIIGHMNKTEKANNIYRGLGSIDITAAARSVLIIGKRKGNERTRFMMQIKNNLSTFGKAISFTINGRGGVEFQGECDISEDEILSPTEEKKTKYIMAKELVTAMLSDGDKNANEMFNACMDAGFAVYTINSVKKTLSIRNIQKPDGDWYWTLAPEGAEPYIPTAKAVNPSVPFLDDITSLKQLPIVPKQIFPQHKQTSVEVMDSPFGELELIDWRACV